MNQADFAKLHSVSRKTVTQWKARGWLVIAGGKIDVEASNANIERYRKTVTQPGKTGTGNKKGNGAGGNCQGNKLPTTLDGETSEQAAHRIIATEGATMSMDEAQRVKENYLALLRQLEYEQKSGALVELELAEKILFEQARAQRDAWLNWPTRVGPLLAAELGLEADRVTCVLADYVHRHIAQLGAPEEEVEFSEKG